jgi:hypothetical protein
VKNNRHVPPFYSVRRSVTSYLYIHTGAEQTDEYQKKVQKSGENNI